MEYFFDPNDTGYIRPEFLINDSTTADYDSKFSKDFGSASTETNTTELRICDAIDDEIHYGSLIFFSDASNKIVGRGMTFYSQSGAPYPCELYFSTPVSSQLTSITLNPNGSTTLDDGELIVSIPAEISGGGGSSALNDLTDVTITSATTGDYLYYNGSGWVNQTALTLDGLTDVNAPSPTDEYVLEWDSGTSKWVPAVDDDTGGSSGVSSIIAGTGISVDSATGTVTITNTVSPTISIDTEELEEILILGVTSQQWGIVLAVAAVVIVLAYAVVRKRR